MTDQVTVLEISDKLQFIKKFVFRQGLEYVPIVTDSIECIYDLYLIVSMSLPETIINKICQYNGFTKVSEWMSTIYLYIGYFCEFHERASDEELTFKIDNVGDTSDPKTCYKIAACYYKMGVEVGNVRAAYRLGQIYLYDLLNYNKTLKYFKRAAMNGYENSGEMFYNGGEWYYDGCEYDRSICFFKMAIDFNYKNLAELYYYLAESYFYKDDYSKSIETYGLAIDNGHGDLGQVYHDIAISFYRLNDNIKSVEYVEKAIANGNTNAWELYLDIDDSYREEKDCESAIIVYKKATKHGCENLGRVYDLIAQCYYDNPKGPSYLKSIKYYELAITVPNSKSDISTLYNNIATAYHFLDDFDKAVEFYTKSIETQNTHTNNAHYNLGNTYCAKGEYDKAILHYHESIEKGQTKSASFYSIAWAYFWKGYYRASIKFFKLSHKDGNHLAVDKMALIFYWKLSNNKKTLKYIRIAIKLFTEGKSSVLDDEFECILKKQDNYDDLVMYYMAKKNSKELILLLNDNDTDGGNKVSINTMEQLGNYFEKNDNPNILHRFIRNIIKLKLDLLELHFKYAISSEGYDQAKEDFYKQIAAT